VQLAGKEDYSSLGEYLWGWFFATIYFLFMWWVYFQDVASGGAISAGWSLVPEANGVRLLKGFLGHSFLHGNASHILGNSTGYIPLAILTVIRIRGKFQYFFWFTAFVVTAIAVVHTLPLRAIPGYQYSAVGMSGVIWGMFGVLFMSAFWRRREFVSLACTGFAIAFFFGMIFGMLPTVPEGVAWQGHAAGFLAGGIVAKLSD
jgi:membrane associated rhomboid family serine protease